MNTRVQQLLQHLGILSLALYALGCADATTGGVNADDSMAGMAGLSAGSSASASDSAIDSDLPNLAGGVSTSSPGGEMHGCVPTEPPTEVCNGQDEDCDGEIDEDVVSRACWEGPAGTQARGHCENGTRTCIDGEWGACEGQVLPVSETCNAVDDDCDGQVDENVFIYDCGVNPSDVAGTCQAPRRTCVAQACMADAQCPDENPCEDGICQGTDWSECGGALDAVDEVCDGLDNDCDGRADEDFADEDEDGISDCVDSDVDGDGLNDPIDNCPDDFNPGQQDLDGDGQGDECDADADGDGYEADDCQPLSAEQYPGAAERCNNVDDDCDSSVDEALARDCFSGPPEGAGVGICREGRQTCDAGIWSVCTGQILPGEETCNGIDEDCDGRLDEGLNPGWPDLDQDGYGDQTVAPTCPAEMDQVDQAGDCDDGDDSIHGGIAFDLPDPDGTDSNCDGVDGVVGNMVFVSIDGNPNLADGSQDAPFTDIETGLTAALTLGADSVAVGAGTYLGTLDLVSGVSVHGGYDPANAWARTPDSFTVIRGNVVSDGMLIGLRAVDIRRPTQITGMTIETVDAAGDGVSTYGVYGRNAPALVLQNLTVRSGAAGAGVPGMGGLAGEAGGNGENGANCDGGTAAGGLSLCGGGPGGIGGKGRKDDRDGDAGRPEGCGGRGGAYERWVRGGNGEGGCAGLEGSTGANAAPGGNGFVASRVDDARWRPGVGAQGQPGQAGTGGGGGGGGGGSEVWIANNYRGGSGGGGGGGGCGGGPGLGGGHGGGSFAIFLVESTGARVLENRLEPGPGGPGGLGGTGGQGGPGGQGGQGGRGSNGIPAECGGVSGPGSGGAGGVGGVGGAGGHGQSGDGGPSFGLYCDQSIIDFNGLDVLLAPPSRGGPDSSTEPVASPPPQGQFGLSAPTFGCQ